MTDKRISLKNLIALMIFLLLFTLVIPGQRAFAAESGEEKSGGGYAVSGQLPQGGYTAVIYDATNGLITSDANYILGSSDGYIWIGGYSGIIRYDGTEFERLSTTDGLTSGRGIFEDSRGRIWVGTNDNGVVVIDNGKRTHYTYRDGLASSSIRIFAEDNEGNVFIGTTSGVAYVDPEGVFHNIKDSRIDEERVLRLDSDSEGRIYGQTKNGLLFSINNCNISSVYSSEHLHIDTITSIMADQNKPGKVYLCTDSDKVYYGSYGEKAESMKEISVAPLRGVHWISYDCDRVWVSSTNSLGYLDERYVFHEIKNLPMNSSIEMTTSDYQGNIWVASSTQGVMKIVSNNFTDYTQKVGLRETVTNATCLFNDKLYIGTDDGLYIVDKNEKSIKTALTEYLKDVRVRCLMTGSDEKLWISTYEGDNGLICLSKDGTFRSYNTENGLPHNQVRCTAYASDGKILVGTNGGVAVIKDEKVVKTYGQSDGLKNTIILTVCENDDGSIYAGTDGDGIYILDGMNVSKLGRIDGLTSDVVMKIVRDEENGVFWIVSSNSIEYIKNGQIQNVSSFPYNNNYDIYFDKTGAAWVLSSCGIYRANTNEMLYDEVANYRLYSIANGLPYAITANSVSCMDQDGNLYLSGRYGVIKVNINQYYEGRSDIKVAVSAVYCGDESIEPDENGRFIIPPSNERISIKTSVMDYTMLNPSVKLFFDGNEEYGITVPKSELYALEYTGLSYGDYLLHIKVLGNNERDVLVDETFDIVKKPRLMELYTIRILFVLLLALATGFLVYRIMKSTVITKQYDEIKQARDEAERANTAKTRFLANISHEIRTPINTIMGMNEMVMREDATDVPKGYFLSMMNYAFDIRNASESLLGLINDLLDLSKIESGKMHLVEKEYDVQDMLRSIVSMVRIRSTQKELTFDVVVDEMLPTRMYGDCEKIKQVVLNLLTNAVKYTENGGFVLSVSLVRREDDICNVDFSVKDTGQGIKEEDMPKLFTAYERLEEEKNSGIQGTGLGLNISSKFAELMGGTLTCESVYGVGSEFVLHVSQKIIDATPMGTFMEHEDEAAKGPYIPQFIAPDADVLVVDDNPMNLSVIKGLLKATKVFVTTATSGEECIDKIRESRFDVLFLDHMMPGMDGIETLEEVRKICPDIPAYALTANAAAGEEFYKSKGFNGYLEKPVDSVTLEKTIMRHLPEKIMEIPQAEDVIQDLTEIPDELKWVYDIKEISVEDGIKNSGGISSYIFSLQLFLETIDGNAKVIKDAYDSGNIRLYTIKVHALKSSARIIGARDLEHLAAQLEEAGNKDNMEFIHGNADRFLDDYFAFKDLLSRLNEGKEDEDEGKESIPDDVLSDAYEALRDVVPQMDYDAVEMIIGQLREYKLPAEDNEKIKELEKLLRGFDWDSMEELIAD